MSTVSVLVCAGSRGKHATNIVIKVNIAMGVGKMASKKGRTSNLNFSCVWIIFCY